MVIGIHRLPPHRAELATNRLSHHAAGNPIRDADGRQLSAPRGSPSSRYWLCWRRGPCGCRLAGAVGDGEGHHAVEADHGEKRGERAEVPRQDGHERSLRSERATCFLERTHAVIGRFEIQLSRHRRRSCPKADFGSVSGAHVDGKASRFSLAARYGKNGSRCVSSRTPVYLEFRTTPIISIGVGVPGCRRSRLPGDRIAVPKYCFTKRSFTIATRKCRGSSLASCGGPGPRRLRRADGSRGP